MFIGAQNGLHEAKMGHLYDATGVLEFLFVLEVESVENTLQLALVVFVTHRNARWIATALCVLSKYNHATALPANYRIKVFLLWRMSDGAIHPQYHVNPVNQVKWQCYKMNDHPSLTAGWYRSTKGHRWCIILTYYRYKRVECNDT